MFKVTADHIRDAKEPPEAVDRSVNISVSLKKSILCINLCENFSLWKLLIVGFMWTFMGI